MQPQEDNRVLPRVKSMIQKVNEQNILFFQTQIENLNFLNIQALNLCDFKVNNKYLNLNASTPWIRFIVWGYKAQYDSLRDH